MGTAATLPRRYQYYGRLRQGCGECGHTIVSVACGTVTDRVLRPALPARTISNHPLTPVP